MAELRTVNPLVVGSSPTLGAMQNAHSHNSNYSMNHLIGRQVQLVETKDKYTKIKPGYTGTISFIDDTGTVFINWQDGSSLGLIPGIDKWKYI